MTLPKRIAVYSFPELTENGASFSESISKALCPRIHFWNSIEKNVRMHLLQVLSNISHYLNSCMI